MRLVARKSLIVCSLSGTDWDSILTLSQYRKSTQSSRHSVFRSTAPERTVHNQSPWVPTAGPCLSSHDSPHRRHYQPYNLQLATSWGNEPRNWLDFARLSRHFLWFYFRFRRRSPPIVTPGRLFARRRVANTRSGLMTATASVTKFEDPWYFLQVSNYINFFLNLSLVVFKTCEKKIKININN